MLVLLLRLRRLYKWSSGWKVGIRILIALSPHKKLFHSLAPDKLQCVKLLPQGLSTFVTNAFAFTFK